MVLLPCALGTYIYNSLIQGVGNIATQTQGSDAWFAGLLYLIGNPVKASDAVVQ